METSALKLTFVTLALFAGGAEPNRNNYWDSTFTVVVPPNTHDQCYHLPDIKFRQDVDVFFQVVRSYWPESGFGNFDQTPPEMKVNMQVMDPAGTVLKSAVDGQFESYRFNAATDGAHKVCLYSYDGQKHVYIRVTGTTPPDPEKESEDWDVYDYFYDEDRAFNEDMLKDMRQRDKDSVQSQFDTTVKVIKESLQAIRANLQLSSSLQSVLMSTLTKDMYIMFTNFSRVNFWSGFYITVMVVTGLLQVYFIRGLFDGDSKTKQTHKIKAVT